MKHVRHFLLIVATLLCSFAVKAQDREVVTGLFSNTDFEGGETTGWTISGPINADPQAINTASRHGYQGTYFMEVWVYRGTILGDFEWSQTQTVPNGTYLVSALAHAKDENDASVTPQGTYLFAEDRQVAVTAVTPTEYTVVAEVTDGTLTIGYRGVGCNSNWAACDDFRIVRPDTNAEYTVTFYDWDGAVLKTEQVKFGQDATAPADPERLGYTFMGWDKLFTTVISDLDIHASYKRNVGSVIVGEGVPIQFQNTDFEGGETTGWTISGPENAQNVGAQNTASRHGYQGTWFMEAWNPERSLGDFEWSQTQTVPNGVYLVSALAHAKDENDASVTPQGTYLFAEDRQVAVTAVTPTEYGVVAEVTDGTLTIGYRGVGCNGNWAACDDFRVSKFDVDTDAEYTVVFCDWDGTVLKTETVKWGKSPTAPANPVRAGYAFVGWDVNYENVYADLVVYATYSSIDDVLPHPAPRAEHWYDFDAAGEKGFVKNGTFTAGVSRQFENLANVSGGNGYITDYYIEDVNGDGAIDISIEHDGGYFQGSGYYGSYISQGGSHVFENGTLIITNFDVNNDGRIDYLKRRSDSRSGFSVMVQQADGSFVEQFMQVVTEAEFEASFDPDDWYSDYSNRAPRPSPVIFSGVALASAPPYRDADVPQMRAQGMNPSVAAPTRALDLNADGYVDLINEKEGILYYNTGDGRWIHTVLGGSVMVADLNGDHIQDFIFPGKELWVAIYRGGGDFEQQTLYENIQVDREMYCYDFDRDGDVDILVTFSAPLNSTGYAYTMFFDNDGTGQFTQLDEQDYGDNNLLFSNCQDLDGDGYYDLLAFRGDFSGKTNQDVVWLKGQPNKTFSQPESLVTISDGNNVNKGKISAEDINSDGYMDVWANVQGVPARSVIGTPNTAPAAPAKPELNYNNGMLTISWGDGSDDRTAASDLTYALRVGTIPGGDDILRAHANADGARRNFLDGNMSKFHNYTLDLTQRRPCAIYVSVQTIDAQHAGSAWSEEAVVEHNGFVADFRISTAEVGCGVSLTATAPAMPDGFTHTWIAEDGVCTGDGHEVEVVFNAAGEKIITHTVTAADGISASYVVPVNVMPNYTDLIEIFATEWEDLLENSYNDPLFKRMADYNMDGYWDVADVGGEAIFKGDANFSFAQAAGVWNTGLSLGKGFWYDWDHNGAMDFLFIDYNDRNCYYLPHNGTLNMKAKKEDENLEAIFDFNDKYKFENSYVDFTHDGNFDLTGYTLSQYDGGNYYKNYLGIKQPDGSYQERLITPLNMKFPSFNSQGCFFADINHDGFTDICAYAMDNSCYQGLSVLVNKGNCVFETMTIPFAEDIYKDNLDELVRYFVDMNNDGYLDFLSMRQDGAPYILWNEQNERFAAPYVLPVGELGRYYIDSRAHYMQVIDLDNNGYLDVMTNQQDESKGNAGYGYYVHYFGAGGVIQQGFVLHCNLYCLKQEAVKLPNHPWAFCLNWYNLSNNASANFGIVTIHGPANERPSAPTNVRAVQTDEGLLIEWNHAADDATPGTHMRYNLSVKKKGASGEGAYIISPQNACNSNAAPLSNFNYITAKQYLVPNSVLPIGEYEIQLQAIDLQGDWSVFTAPITVAVEEVCAIASPASVCSGDIARLTYAGSQSTETPVWDFDGAKVESGSGYGPYDLYWNTTGTKTVTLTLGDKVTTRMIYVEEEPYNIYIPRLFNYTTNEVKIPEGVKVEWRVSTTGNPGSYYPLSAYNEDEIKIEGNKITLNTNNEKLYFRITLTNASGCETVYNCESKVEGLSELIQIYVVTTDAEGHNIIRWNYTNACAEVRILKETNRRNQYVEIGVANVSDMAYTDYSSNAAVQSECYVLQAVLPELEITVPYSKPHTTSHLTINRGLTNNTWNLIWSAYEGESVLGYNILRGASPDNLKEIASVSSRHTTYTDYAPDANAPYYAIEYVLEQGASYAPGMNRATARAAGFKGQSNVVNGNMANTVVYANSVSILSATKKYKMNEDNPVLALYAEILPASATLRNVRWEIVGGNDLATIASSGILTAKKPNAGGVVTVQATTIDGTDISATRQITVEAIGVVSPAPEPEYTVTFCDWDGTVLKSESVQKGQAATAPAEPTREGYTFTGWDKSFTNVQSDLTVNAVYTQNSVVPAPGTDELAFATRFTPGTNGWIDGTEWHNLTEKIAVYASPLYRGEAGKVTKLRITVNSTKGDTKYFCLSELEFYDENGSKIALAASNVVSNADHNALNPTATDGGGFAALFDGQTGTYFHSAWKNMPAEDHYLEVTFPGDGYNAFSFKMFSRARTIENNGLVYDQSHTFPAVMVMNTAIAVKAEENTVTEPKPELDNETLYHVTQPHHEYGATSWIVARGGNRLQSNIELGVVSDSDDARQRFSFISHDGGTTHYLYHPAEGKYVNKDGSLGAIPLDAVCFKPGAYQNTFVVYFDNAHFVNVEKYRALVIDDWGPGGRIGVADGGNSCLITAVGEYDITNVGFMFGEGTPCVKKVIEKGVMFILMPDGSKYTLTGVRVK